VVLGIADLGLVDDEGGGDGGSVWNFRGPNQPLVFLEMHKSQCLLRIRQYMYESVMPYTFSL